MIPPFPGMDPYLEAPSLWPDVHNGLIAAIREKLGPMLRPGYFVRLEERTYLADPEGLAFVGRPDLAVIRGATERPRPGSSAAHALAVEVEVPVPDPVKDTYLEVRAAHTGDVVTILELLSPSNKRPGEGRVVYEAKRRSVLGTRTSLVEIDLLRGGVRMPVIGPTPVSDYTILISRGDRRPRADLISFGVRDSVPVFDLPLRSGDVEPGVDVGAILRMLYDVAAYELSIDYRGEPSPPLTESDRPWAHALLRGANLRQ